LRTGVSFAKVDAGGIVERPIHVRQIDKRPQVKILTGMTKDNPRPPLDPTFGGIEF